MYDSIMLTVGVLADLAIVWLMIREARKVVEEVDEIRESTSGTIYSASDADDLAVGGNVHVLQPRPGVPRNRCEYGPEIYVIREADRARNRGLATPIMPPQGPTPTVEGPLRGPLSPFKKAFVPG